MLTMKKKELEMTLQKIPGMAEPSPSLEQYQTPANIAADILFNAYDDIYGKCIIDMGCGTGIFCIGSALMGAKEVVGIDIDGNAIKVAKTQAKKFGLENISFIEDDVENIDASNMAADTAIMNPPFGSQLGNRKADRIFLKRGLEVSPVVYSIHLKDTIPFIETLVSSLGGEITYSKNYSFPIKKLFPFHKKKVVVYDVTLIRTVRPQKRRQ